MDPTCGAERARASHRSSPDVDAGAMPAQADGLRFDNELFIIRASSVAEPLAK